MKPFLLIVFCLISTLQYAQPDKYAMALMTTPAINFTEKLMNVKESSHPFLTVHIAAEEDAFSKHFRNWIKTKYMLEGKKNGAYILIPGSKILEWSSDSLNIYFKTQKEADGANLAIALERANGFISEKETPEIIAAMKKSISIQIRDFYILYYDQHITDQQKHYEKQVAELEKLRKKQTRMSSDKTSKEESVRKTNEAIREANVEISKSDNEIKLLEAQFNQNKKAVELAQSAYIEAGSSIKSKEQEFTKLNSSGSLNTKEGVRVTKDLEKMREKQIKLEAVVSKANEVRTKSESAVLKEQRNKTELEAKQSELKANVDKLNAEIESLDAGIKKLEQSIIDQQTKIDLARSDLDRLKSAQAGVSGR